MICMIFAALNAAQEATAAAEKEAERQARLMNAIVENIPAGVCLFDSDLKLIVYNREFPKLLGVPGEVLERRPSFRDPVRFNAERGEYGDRSEERRVGKEWVSTYRSPG